MDAAAIDRRAPVGAQVLDVIEAAILDLRLPPGQRLSEKELALQLGVSRTPVREAFIKLSRERLVEVFPQAGTYVARIRRADVVESQFVREALECAAIRDAIGRIAPADVADLRRIVADQRRLLEEEQPLERFYALDQALHRRLMEVSGHPLAWAFADRMRIHLERVRRLSLPVPRQLDDLIVQHAAIVDAVERRDADAASAALSLHLREILSTVDMLERRHPEYFTS